MKTNASKHKEPASCNRGMRGGKTGRSPKVTDRRAWCRCPWPRRRRRRLVERSEMKGAGSGVQGCGGSGRAEAKAGRQGEKVQARKRTADGKRAEGATIPERRERNEWFAYAEIERTLDAWSAG